MVNPIDCTGAGVFAVIVAAGTGTRFGSDIPKQFLPLGQSTVLMTTVDAFRRALPEAKIILMLSDDGEAIWRHLCGRYNYESSATIAIGGSTRSETVRRALAACRAAGASDDSIIMIHDGARPLVSPQLIRKLVSSVAEGNSAAVPGYAPTDSMEEMRQGYGVPRLRDNYRCVQTPQTFRAGAIFRAYEEALKHSDSRLDSSDDATIAAQYGGCNIVVVDGERTNIKITHPDDIAIAELFLARRAEAHS